MKKWHKYFLSYENEKKFLPRDETFDDHKASMHWNDSDKGYGSKEEFFKIYFYGAHPRHRFYHDYLTRKLKKEDEVLSVGSGRCVNELLLMEEGFNITCSDLDRVCQKPAENIFPHMKFFKYDAARGSCEHKFDCVISLSVFYLFDKDELLRVFAHIADSLKAGGTFIFDPGGAENNLLTKMIDDFICPSEPNLVRIARKVIKGKKSFVTKKHQGYRTTNGEIITIAGKAGFQLRDMECGDYMTELRRSIFFQKLPDSIVGLLGRTAPYVRMFNFKKQ